MARDGWRKGPVGVADHRLVVDHLLPVQHDGGVAVHNGDLVALPLASRSARVLSGLDPAEDGADTLQPLHATVPVDDLRLVGSAYVDPAVSSGWTLNSMVSLESPKTRSVLRFP